jgi:hypothetical protein
VNRPEHLLIHEINFDSNWEKSPERLQNEQNPESDTSDKLPKLPKINLRPSIFFRPILIDPKAKKTGSLSYFVIRNEWDNRCVAFIARQFVLVRDCQMPQAVWELTEKSTIHVALKNYYADRFLAFKTSERTPLMIEKDENNLSKWNLKPVHTRNRRWSNDVNYWNVTYNVIQNVGTGACLMIDGDTVSQSSCQINRPEHLSFQEVEFDPTWIKNYEKYEDKIKNLPQTSDPNKPWSSGSFQPFSPIDIYGNSNNGKNNNGNNNNGNNGNGNNNNGSNGNGNNGNGSNGNGNNNNGSNGNGNNNNGSNGNGNNNNGNNGNGNNNNGNNKNGNNNNGNNGNGNNNNGSNGNGNNGNGNNNN